MTRNPHPFALHAWIALALFAGCTAPAAPPTEGAQAGDQHAEFESALDTFATDYGSGDKADFLGATECDLLEPFYSANQDFTKGGFILGGAGYGSAGFDTASRGFDLVWDVYHQEFFAAKYHIQPATRFTVPGAAIRGYVGFASGFRHGVTDWNGYLVNASFSVPIPQFAGFLWLRSQTFATAIDRNHDRKFTVDEVVAPPGAVFGSIMGVELTIPSAFPFAAGIATNNTKSFPEGTRFYYDMFRSGHILAFGSPISVRLVDSKTGAVCPDTWPEADPDRECIVQFGDPEWSFTHRALHTAYSICEVTNGCSNPLAPKLASGTIAIGALRDGGEKLLEDCGLPTQAGR